MKFLQLIKKGATAPTPEEGVLYYDENTESITLRKPIELVDLGLPSGLLWASCNVGASKPYEYGKYFQWGDTVGYEGEEAKAHSTWDTCPWGTSTPPMATLDTEHDAATANLGEGYRMPTQADINELNNWTTKTWVESGNTEFNGVAGLKLSSIVDPNRYIFIPAAGYYASRIFSDVGRVSYALSCSLSDTHYAYSHTIYVIDGVPPSKIQGTAMRYLALPIRAVKPKNA